MDAMFPKLTAAQIARLLPVGRRRRFAPREMVYERGSSKRAFSVLLERRVEIASPSRVGEERVAIHETGFTGEVDMISLPRVFAVGDVRSGSMKRVASAVGEGSAAVQLVHKVLAE